MKKTSVVWGVLIIVIASAATYFLMVNKVEAPGAPHDATQVTAFDPKNATYLIDGAHVTLVDGVSEIEVAPGSASKISTRYFGNEARGDLNGDGIEDIAFLITHEGGGSGTFFYVVVALSSPTGYATTNVVLLGDRIAPQTTEIETGELRVNYADRQRGESMSTQPSVGVTLRLKVVDHQLVPSEQ